MLGGPDEVEGEGVGKILVQPDHYFCGSPQDYTTYTEVRSSRVSGLAIKALYSFSRSLAEMNPEIVVPPDCNERLDQLADQIKKVVCGVFEQAVIVVCGKGPYKEASSSSSNGDNAAAATTRTTVVEEQSRTALAAPLPLALWDQHCTRQLNSRTIRRRRPAHQMLVRQSPRNMIATLLAATYSGSSVGRVQTLPARSW